MRSIDQIKRHYGLLPTYRTGGVIDAELLKADVRQLVGQIITYTETKQNIMPGVTPAAASRVLPVEITSIPRIIEYLIKAVDEVERIEVERLKRWADVKAKD